MKSHYQMIVIGQLTLDDVVLFDQPALLDSPGGSGLYALAGVCFWETGPLGFVTRRGNDYHLEPVFAQIENDLDLRGVNEFDAPSIHIWNLFDRRGNRYFIKQRWGSGDEIMGVLPEDIPEDYLNSKGFLVAAYPVEYQSKVVGALPGEATILVDPHFQGIYPEYHDLWNSLFPKIDIFLPSEDELIRFFGVSVEGDFTRYIPYLKDISGRGPKVAGVKLGENGALVYDREEDTTWFVPAYVHDQITDVTGCGDAFCGGFMASYMQNGDTFISTVRGVASASFNLEDYGVTHNFATKKIHTKQRFDYLLEKLDRNKQVIH